ncbi:uncharacterized protein LOC142230806 [Haematobia irritans]|uniref:uncharacterized protein LOC142230806 n=1 Tax=Haematobia irritans TaxID=7368 RepID=UPI003F4FAE67
MDTTAAPYRTCGEILLGNLSKSKRQYVLKCSCNEEFFLFEDFIIHHSDLHVDDERDQHLEGNDFLDEVQQHEYCKEKVEQVFDEIDEKEESTNNRCIEELFEEIDEAETDDENLVQVPESVKKTSETNPDSEDEGNDGQFQSDEDEITLNAVKNKNFISTFLASQENFNIFVDAYKCQPQLWNYKLYPINISKQEEDMCIQNIAKDIEDRLNIQMTSQQVHATIFRIRKVYKGKLDRLAICDEQAALKASRSGYMSKLSFLEPFLTKHCIAKIDPCQAELSQDEIIELLHIYEKFPNLWNTNLLENVCKNKRDESLQQMTEAINARFGMTIHEYSLNKYLDGIQKQFYQEKSTMIRTGGHNFTPSVYYQHMQFLTDHVGPFYCSECDRKYRSPLQLKVHKKECHNGEPLSCPQCGKEYDKVLPYVAHARRHMHDLHDQCTVCGKMFIRKAELNLHMRSHTGEKPYFCEICGATFSNPNYIRDHKERHSNEFKVFCSICSRGFYTKKQLKRHLNTKHSNVRNFVCKQCGKAFKTKTNLVCHELTHEEGRKYPCPLCGKMYKNTIGVSQHLRTHRSKVGTESYTIPNKKLSITETTTRLCYRYFQNSSALISQREEEEKSKTLTELIMEKYADYLRCGEIYKSPAHSNKTPYILKCYQCADIFLLLESFIFHIEDYCNGSASGGHDEDETLATQQKLETPIEEEVVVVKNEPIQNIEFEEVILEESGNIAAVPENGSSTDDADEGCDGFEVYEVVDISDSDDDVNMSADSTTLSSFVTTFMESRTNVIELIAIYKRHVLDNETKLSYCPKLKRRDLENITSKFNNKRRLNTTCQEINAVIEFLQHQYNQSSKELNETNGEKSIKINWYIQFLNFLEIYNKDGNIYQIENHPSKLTHEIILKILQIYQEFPYLWNTNLVEYCCNNKRRVALEEMSRTLEMELDLKVSVNALRKYLQCIHSFCQREKKKRILIKNNSSMTNFSDEFYKNMTFLWHHVGPFQCPQCEDEIKCPFTLRIHKFSSHGGPMPFTCSLCKQQFRTSNLYVYHAKWHMNDLNIECKLCNKKFINASELKAHMQAHKQQKQTTIKSTANSNILLNTSSKGVTKRPVALALSSYHKCHDCGIMFTTLSSLQLHMKRHAKLLKKF